MRFLVDECVGPTVAKWLRNLGHDILSIYDSLRGLDDLSIIRIAFKEKRIVITNDKDFGTLAVLDKEKHSGIILLRLKDETVQNKINILEKVINIIPENSTTFIIIASENNIRIIN